MTLKNSLTFTAILGLLFITALVMAFSFHSFPAEGSTLQGQEYLATSTSSNGAYGGTLTSGRLIRTGSGSLASVIITGANTGVINFYNATTTDITQRAPSMSTSTILIASFPASVAVGTYTIDALYDRGLYFDLVSGVAPTSTITYR